MGVNDGAESWDPSLGAVGWTETYSLALGVLSSNLPFGIFTVLGLLVFHG